MSADLARLPQPGIGRVDHAALHEHMLRRLAGPEAIASHPDEAQLACFLAFARQWMCAEEERALPQEMPTRDDFDGWFLALRKQHRLRTEPLFEHLAGAARIDQMAFYICAEAGIDRRFQDVMALAQVGLGGEARQVMAVHYWDEMGRGHADEVHACHLRSSASHFQHVLEGLPWRSWIARASEDFADANLLLLWALERCYLPRLLGALTLLEHAAPYRHARLVQGMRRLKVPPEAIYFHELHVHISARHGDDLLRRVIKPLVARHPALLHEVALGMLIHHQVSVDHCARMAARLGLG